MPPTSPGDLHPPLQWSRRSGTLPPRQRGKSSVEAIPTIRGQPARARTSVIPGHGMGMQGDAWCPAPMHIHAAITHCLAPAHTRTPAYSGCHLRVILYSRHCPEPAALLPNLEQKALVGFQTPLLGISREVLTFSWQTAVHTHACFHPFHPPATQSAPPTANRACADTHTLRTHSGATQSTHREHT